MTASAFFVRFCLLVCIMTRNLFNKWERWLDRILSDQLRDLVISQHIFHQFADVTKPYAGTYEASELAHWISQGYVAFAATAIRRMIESPNRQWNSVSLVILLDDVRTHASLFTRSWQRRRYRRAISHNLSIADKQADKDFYRVTRNKRVTCLPKDRVDRDIAALKRRAKPISRLVNKVIAHTEADRRRIGKVRYAEIDNMIELLTETYQRYYLLIRGRVRDPLVPLSGFEVKEALQKVWP